MITNLTAASNRESLPQAVPARIIWRRPLMVRQPYSVAVLSTRGRLHPLVPEVSVPQNWGNRRGRKDY